MDYLLKFCNDYLGLRVDDDCKQIKAICDTINYHETTDDKGFTKIFANDIHIATKWSYKSSNVYDQLRLRHYILRLEFNISNSIEAFEPYLIPLFQTSINKFKEAYNKR